MADRIGDQQRSDWLLVEDVGADAQPREEAAAPLHL
jgi:hypothetical protein